MKVPALDLVKDVVNEYAWSEDTCIRVLCEFIDQLNTPNAEPDFMNYIDDKVADELFAAQLDGKCPACQHLLQDDICQNTNCVY